MAALQATNIGLRFLLELGALLALGYWGFSLPGPWTLRLLAGLGLPFLAAFLWGRYAAPASARRLAPPGLLVFELLVFGSAGLALVAAQRPALALVFTALVLTNLSLLQVWGAK